MPYHLIYAARENVHSLNRTQIDKRKLSRERGGRSIKIGISNSNWNSLSNRWNMSRKHNNIHRLLSIRSTTRNATSEERNKVSCARLTNGYFDSLNQVCVLLSIIIFQAFQNTLFCYRRSRTHPIFFLLVSLLFLSFLIILSHPSLAHTTLCLPPRSFHRTSLLLLLPFHVSESEMFGTHEWMVKKMSKRRRKEYKIDWVALRVAVPSSLFTSFHRHCVFCVGMKT